MEPQVIPASNKPRTLMNGHRDFRSLYGRPILVGRFQCPIPGLPERGCRVGRHAVLGVAPYSRRPAPRRFTRFRPWRVVLVLLTGLVASPALAADEPCAHALQEQRRLAGENAQLAERLRKSGLLADLSRQIDQQSALLARLATILDLDVVMAAEQGDSDADGVALADENARLRAELDAANRRLELLIAQFAAAHGQRIDALAEAAAVRENRAELDARLRQRQLAADEALLRADKTEKLYAALQEAHRRVTTENERLTRDLETARERQSEVLQRVVELDSQLADTQARAVQMAGTSDAGAIPRPFAGPSVPERFAGGNTSFADGAETRTRVGAVIYRVRANDTLSGISEKVYGDPSAWTRIYEANRDVLKSPDDLALGMGLLIP